jgi:hypothetical protein
MIEGVTCEDEEAEEYIEATNFRIAGPLTQVPHKSTPRTKARIIFISLKTSKNY